ncbi:MAG: ABC-type transport auxiliary lipoprotein family protein [Thermomonas sp.]
MNKPTFISAALAMLFLPVLLGGCSLLGSPKDSPTIYAPDPRVETDPTWPAVAWQLSTTRPTAPRMMDSLRIAVSPVPGELEVYKDASWSRTPTEMVEDGVLRALEDSGKIPAVARQGSGIGADYRLVMDLRHFEAEYAGEAVPSAVIEVNVKLLHSQDQSVVGSRTFRQAQPATGTSVDQVADAFSQALGATSHDIAGWILVTGHTHESKHPSNAH